MAILHIHRNQILFLEQARVSIIDNRVVYSQSEKGIVKTWNIPSFNLSCLILGTGCSITTAATRLLSDSGTYVMHSGSGGTPVFMTSLTDYRPTKIFQKWITFWTNENARLEVAKFLAHKRCENLYNFSSYPQKEIFSKSNFNELIQSFDKKIDDVKSINELTGYEGNFTRQLYNNMAKTLNINWIKRDNSQDRNNKHNLDKLLDDGNYILYGIAGLSIFLMGLVPQVPVTHGKTRSGGLIFDISDVFKDSISLPCAFLSHSQGYTPGSEYRKRVVDWCDKNNALKRHIEIIKEATELGFKTVNGDANLILEDLSFNNELNQIIDIY